MEKTTEETEGPKKAVVNEEPSRIEMLVAAPIIMVVLIAAAVGSYVIVANWSSSSATIEPDGTVQYEETKWWTLFGGQTVKYEYNAARGHWSKSVKLQREKDFSSPEPLPQASNEIGQ